jgi:hypothetical protein
MQVGHSENGVATHIADAILAELTSEQRAHLVHRLEQLAVAEMVVSRRIHLARRWLPRLLVLGCVGMVPWIVLLAIRLPRHYVAGHWQAAWIGFDVVLLTSLAVTAWSLWQQRQIVIVASLTTAILLICDAWFDITTSRLGGDLLTSVLSAALVELPLAAGLLMLSERLRRVTMRLSQGLTPADPLPSMWRTPLPTAVIPRPPT